MKVGDTVRYLNAVGGGIIKRIEGRVAYVEENGFETPVLVNELVTVIPAGHAAQSGAKLMFDQQAFDNGRKPEPAAPAQPHADKAADKPLPPAPDTAHGEKLNIALAFEPSDVKRLSESTFNTVLVNDSNYSLDFSFMHRADGDKGWTVVYRGTAGANELIDIASYSHAELPQIERVALQAIAYKEGKEFTLKAPVSVTRRLDLTKFHKLHCFRPGIYFETPVLEIPLVKNDIPVETIAAPTAAAAKKLSEKFKVSKARTEHQNPGANPRKLLPPIEVDLHIAELTDNLNGLKPADMLELQLEEVRKVMSANSRRIGQKIIFIHGKGEGVLRKAVLELIRKQWPKAEIQDASFQEYGFGASLITIH